MYKNMSILSTSTVQRRKCNQQKPLKKTENSSKTHKRKQSFLLKGQKISKSHKNKGRCFSQLGSYTNNEDKHQNSIHLKLLGPTKLIIDDEEYLNDKAANMEEEITLLRTKLLEGLKEMRPDSLPRKQPQFQSVLMIDSESRILETSKIFVQSNKINKSIKLIKSKSVFNKDKNSQTDFIGKLQKKSLIRKLTRPTSSNQSIFPSSKGSQRCRLTQSFIRTFGLSQIEYKNNYLDKTIHRFVNQLNLLSERIAFSQELNVLDKKQFYETISQMRKVWKNQTEIQKNKLKIVKADLKQQVLNIMEAKRLKKISLKRLDDIILS